MAVHYFSNNFVKLIDPNLTSQQFAVDEYKRLGYDDKKVKRNRGNETEGNFLRAYRGTFVQAMKDGKLLYDKNGNPIYEGYASHPDKDWDIKANDPYNKEQINISYKSTHRSRIKQSTIQKIKNKEGYLAIGNEWLPGSFLDMDSDEAAKIAEEYWTESVRAQGNLEPEKRIKRKTIGAQGKTYEIMPEKLFKNLVSRLDQPSYHALYDDLQQNISGAPEKIVNMYLDWMK